MNWIFYLTITRSTTQLSLYDLDLSVPWQIPVRNMKEHTSREICYSWSCTFLKLFVTFGTVNWLTTADMIGLWSPLEMRQEHRLCSRSLMVLPPGGVRVDDTCLPHCPNTPHPGSCAHLHLDTRTCACTRCGDTCPTTPSMTVVPFACKYLNLKISPFHSSVLSCSAWHGPGGESTRK